MTKFANPITDALATRVEMVKEIKAIRLAIATQPQIGRTAEHEALWTRLAAAETAILSEMAVLRGYPPQRVSVADATAFLAKQCDDLIEAAARTSKRNLQQAGFMQEETAAWLRDQAAEAISWRRQTLTELIALVAVETAP